MFGHRMSMVATGALLSAAGAVFSLSLGGCDGGPKVRGDGGAVGAPSLGLGTLDDPCTPGQEYVNGQGHTVLCTDDPPKGEVDVPMPPDEPLDPCDFGPCEPFPIDPPEPPPGPTCNDLPGGCFPEPEPEPPPPPDPGPEPPPDAGLCELWPAVTYSGSGAATGADLEPTRQLACDRALDDAASRCAASSGVCTAVAHPGKAGKGSCFYGNWNEERQARDYNCSCNAENLCSYR